MKGFLGLGLIVATLTMLHLPMVMRLKVRYFPEKQAWKVSALLVGILLLCVVLCILMFSLVGYLHQMTPLARPNAPLFTQFSGVILFAPLFLIIYWFTIIKLPQLVIYGVVIRHEASQKSLPNQQQDEN